MRLKSRLARSERRLNRFWERFAIVFSVLILIGFGFACYFTSWFRVEGVYCQADGRDCEPGIWSTVLANFKNRPLWLIKKQQVQELVLGSFEYVDSVEVTKNWPQVVGLKISYRQAVIETCETSTPVSAEDNFILPGEANCTTWSEDAKQIPNENQILPKFYISESGRVSISRLCQLAVNLKKEAFEIREGWVLRGQPVVIVTIGGRKVVFSLEKEIEMQVDSLQSILAQAKMSDRPVSQVDFRFDKPVVRFVKN